MRRRSRAGSVKSRRRKPAAPKRPGGIAATRPRSSSAASQGTVVARLTRERDEALLRETANAEILRLISKSPRDLELVFRTILEDATRICNAKFGTLFRFDGENYHSVAQFNTPTALLKALTRRGPFKPTPGTPIDQVMRTKQVIHCADMAAEPVPGLATKLGGARSLVAVPMFKDDALIGAILIYRQEVRPFTDKQIELVKNFAAQAVIAIENARLLNELRESLEQQTATADVLRVISSSVGHLNPVFQAILANAIRLCEANFGNLFLREGSGFRTVAIHSPPSAYTEWYERHPFVEPTKEYPHSTLARLAETKEILHIADLRLDRGYLEGYPPIVALVDGAGARTDLLVPMSKEDHLIGAIVIYRTEVRPFSAKQIALMQNFAAQAVIAIENARLLNELRQRTADLSESLEQQTATSEVLKVISSSPGDLQPVFSAMLESAARLCDASFGNIFRWEDDALRLVATYNTPAAFAETRSQLPLHRYQNNPIAEMLAAKTVLHVDDLAADERYTKRRDPNIIAAVELGGIRTFLAVPMLKDNELIGALIVYRQEVRPFTEKQIALVQNFAAQAVIAIENARLLNELQESLQQQTATADVLKVISRSTFNLQAVLDTLAKSAAELCDASQVSIWRLVGETYHFAAGFGHAAERSSYLSQLSLSAGRGTVLGRVVLDARPIQVSDVQADREYDATIARSGDNRAILGVPLLREETPIGVLLLLRPTTRPFTGRQIELATTFADQAVIAIENARLLSELRERTEQLQAQSEEVAKLNQQLEQRVADQVGEIERMSRLRRFLPPQVADLIVASGTEKQLESHRREITALFCDLRGFTGFSESSDPEDVMALLREYHAAIGEIIIKYSGTLERYAGDGVMVIFNDPVPVENPALQAVLMALDMRMAIGGLIEKWRDLGHDLGFGIGIAHGFATLGTIGFEGRRDYAAIGTVSNVASRLCDEAKPGQILISPRVRQAVEKAVMVEPIGEFALKGIRRPMAAYNVLSAETKKLS